MSARTDRHAERMRRLGIVPMVVVDQPVPPTESIFDAELLGAWAMRDCFICGKRGACQHREPDVDMALIEAFAARRIFQENRLRCLQVRQDVTRARIAS